MGYNRKSYNRKELIKLIQQKAIELGRTPTMKEFKQFQTAIKCFGTWSNFQNVAGLKVTYLRDLTDKKGYMITELQELAKQLGRTPHSNEYGRYDQSKKVFGTWNNALKAANLKINKK